MNYLKNEIPLKRIESIRKLRWAYLIIFILFAVLFTIFLKPSSVSGYAILLVIYVVALFAYEYISYKSLYWHFSRIRFTPEGVYLYRDTVKYLPKEKYIPWEKIIGFNMGKNAAILTINYNPYYLYGEAKESAPYYFLLYGVKKNPKIKKFIDDKYPFLYEKYRTELEDENKPKRLK